MSLTTNARFYVPVTNIDEMFSRRPKCVDKAYAQSNVNRGAAEWKVLASIYQSMSSIRSKFTSFVKEWFKIHSVSSTTLLIIARHFFTFTLDL